MKKRKPGEPTEEPVLSKHEVPEGLFLHHIQEDSPPVDVIVAPPAIVIDDKKPKKDK